ncbi:hypothetical protein V9K92_10330 [Phyllobacterium sp. CCNWLW109]|uniref:hypothetical protein n=1 Tax=Phyllobacterium sp. CCNWLW109 TaxID=3127479 RepID=UPI0030787291
MKKASPQLEAFIDETIRISAEKGYHPTEFIRMRRDYDTIPAITRLVISGEIQSGFKRLDALGLLDYTIEAAVLKFPEEFSKDARECAEYRLERLKLKDD